MIYADLFMGNAAISYSKNGYGYAMEKADTTVGWSFTVFEEVFNQGYPHELKHFVDCVRNDKQPLVTGEDGLAVLEIIYAAYASAGSGKRLCCHIPLPSPSPSIYSYLQQNIPLSDETTNEEFWLRGPISGVPALLQPVAHALLQANEEIHEVLEEFDTEELWQQPSGVASVGFHLQHIVGVLDRLFTYAQGRSLSKDQLKYLSEEGLEDERISFPDLLLRLSAQVIISIEYLKTG